MCVLVSNELIFKHSSLPALHYLHEGCPQGGPAVYMFLQCTPLLVEKAGVAPDINIGFTVCKQVSMQVRESPWL